MLHVHGKAAREAFEECGAYRVVVANGDVPRAPERCLVLTPDVLRDTGAVALYLDGETIRFVTAREKAGDRIWSQWRSAVAPRLAVPTPVLARSQ